MRRRSILHRSNKLYREYFRILTKVVEGKVVEVLYRKGQSCEW